MANQRSINELIQSFIDYLKIVQPDADSKPGSVIRDIVIDTPSNALALLYEELSSVSDQQSYRLVAGSDLDKLAKNFGLSRKSATNSSGVALLTFSSVDAPLSINKGDLTIASNGFSYAVQNGISISPSLSNFYKSVASKFRNDLDFVGISDEFAVEVTVQATSGGISGNLGKYALIRTNIAGVNNVTNVNVFSGGGDSENDAIFRDRVLSVFSGSSVGTNLGYKNTALATTGVIDAFVVEPGDPLMTRDGSVVSTANDGTKTVISEGTGGKVDVVILGSSLTENTDSFIYRDKSNNNDPSNSKNDVVLGQISGDENKTINRKRIDNIKNASLPAQPIEEILEVSGSSSGSNFKEKTVDSFGRTFGNFELLKDTSLYAGSPWGFDKFHWISDRISDFSEDKIKGQFNGQDALTFSDVLEIPTINQNISITNENSLISNGDRSLIQLLHFPVSNITRVFNVNTGERYVVADQNPDGSTDSSNNNTTGRIKISGNTLPTSSDVLQVDYSWVVAYDQFNDYDGRLNTNNLRSVDDSIDWGYSSLIRSEKVNFIRNSGNTFFVGNVVQPISSVINVNSLNTIEGVVSEISSGLFVGRLAIIVNDLENEIADINSITLSNSNLELYNTSQGDGSFSTTITVSGINLRFITTIILPSDTLATVGDICSIEIDGEDLFNVDNSNGNFNSSQITFPSNNVDSADGYDRLCKVNYIANTPNLFNATIPSLPASRSGNGFDINKNTGFLNNFITDTIKKDILIVQKNLSNQFYVELNLSNVESIIDGYSITSIVRLSDSKELWNVDNQGTLSVNSSNNNYQAILSGINTPATGDRILIIYSSREFRRFQPFTFSNDIFKTHFGVLTTDLTNTKFTANIQDFIAETNLHFSILDSNNNDIVLSSKTDGYFILNSDHYTVKFGSTTTNFSNIPNVIAKKIKITGSNNLGNNGIFDIFEFNSTNNSLTLGNVLDHIEKRQISIFRIADGKDLWDSSGVIDIDLNILAFTKNTSLASEGDKVFIIYKNCNNLKQAEHKLGITISDQSINSGVITVNGTTITKGTDLVFTATSNGLKQNMLEAMRKALNLSSITAIPNNISLVKIAKLEKVNTVSVGSDEVLSIIATYDLKQTKINDNSFFLYDLVQDTSLTSLEFTLPNSNNNISNTIKIGDKIRITFYYATSNDFENLTFTRNGTLYTNKNFALIDKIFIASGFSTSQSARITVSSFNQPIAGSRYKVSYDYSAPKANERIIIRSNYNKLISDTTFNIENNRPINADVLVRADKEVLLDLTMNIVISTNYLKSADLVKQNLKDALLSNLTINQLGAVIDASDLVNVAYTVNGIDRARIIYFNKTGESGQVLSITAQQDEHFVANNVIVNQENR